MLPPGSQGENVDVTSRLTGRECGYYLQAHSENGRECGCYLQAHSENLLRENEDVTSRLTVRTSWERMWMLPPGSL